MTAAVQMAGQAGIGRIRTGGGGTNSAKLGAGGLPAAMKVYVAG
jgi:hypothetical protein